MSVATRQLTGYLPPNTSPMGRSHIMLRIAVRCCVFFQERIHKIIQENTINDLMHINLRRSEIGSIAASRDDNGNGIPNGMGIRHQLGNGKEWK